MGYINKYIVAGTIACFYWLPKNIVISSLEFLFPAVITRNKEIRDNPGNIYIDDNKRIALTFDDVLFGNHQEIISILDDYGMKGTFFVISGDVDNPLIYNSLVSAVKNGHQLANHGRTNSMHYLKNSATLIDEILHCDKLIHNIYADANADIEINHLYYRPVCGLFGPQMLNIVKKLGYKLALGSVYPNDIVVTSSTINYLYLINHIEKGDVVILHDRSWTPHMLSKLLVWMAKRNYQSVTLANLFR